jgi:uncharacterized Fe-S cluster-containing MiaB family protein|tara:strand:- start:295 stop:534 length:240 start_codon:yes stop_codon:yes gene_type:complete
METKDWKKTKWDDGIKVYENTKNSGFISMVENVRTYEITFSLYKIMKKDLILVETKKIKDWMRALKYAKKYMYNSSILL